MSNDAPKTPGLLFLVWETEYPEEGSLQLFAESSQLAEEAYRLATGDTEIGEDTPALSTLREPRFDVFADKGEVPNLALFCAGWAAECAGCGGEVVADSKGETLPVIVGEQVWCWEACRAAKGGAS